MIKPGDILKNDIIISHLPNKIKVLNEYKDENGEFYYINLSYEEMKLILNNYQFVWVTTITIEDENVFIFKGRIIPSYDFLNQYLFYLEDECWKRSAARPK